MRASPQTFNLTPGSRSVQLNMRRMTAAGSLYGGIQVFAKQQAAEGAATASSRSGTSSGACA